MSVSSWGLSEEHRVMDPRARGEEASLRMEDEGAPNIMNRASKG